MAAAALLNVKNELEEECSSINGVRLLCDKYNHLTVPSNYVLPIGDRPCSHTNHDLPFSIPVVDFSLLHGPLRPLLLHQLDHACTHYGFFMLVNHGVREEVREEMMEEGRSFFELPMEERQEYISNDVYSPVRCGTGLSHKHEKALCWRDFLKLSCEDPHLWPPFVRYRRATMEYARETKEVFGKLVVAIMENLGLEREKGEFEKESQVMVLNSYPRCPQPELTLAMHPHSDYGFLTLLLQQDGVSSLQIMHAKQWLTVHPIPHSFVVNVGDHLEIFSNGRYKSIIHRVLANSEISRMSVASIHSMCFDRVIRPSPKLITNSNPRKYKDTDFAAFLKYVSSMETKGKGFLESMMLS